MQALITIGLPVFNGQEFIADTLDSILKQTYENFNLIISDNNSTDRTYEICNNYAELDNRIKLYKQPKNIGITSNFEFVLKKSNSIFFMFIAADDIIQPNWLSELILCSQSQKTLRFGRIQIINDRNAKQQNLSNHVNLSFKGSRIVRRISFFIQNPKYGKANLMYGIFPVKLFDLENLHMLEKYNYGSDNLIIYKVLNKMDINSISTSVLNKRVHSRSISSTDNKFTFKSKGIDLYSKSNNFFKLLISRILPFYKESNIVEKGLIILLSPLILFQSLNDFIKIKLW